MDASKINGLKQYSSQKFSAGTEGQKLEENKCFWGGQSQDSSSSGICEDFFPKNWSWCYLFYFIAIINFFNNAKKI